MTEDLTTYTEVDPNSHISATASRATGTNVARNETCYLYCDKGANHFDALDIDFDLCVTTSVFNGLLGILGLSNELKDFGAFGNNDIRVYHYYYGTEKRIHLQSSTNDYAVGISTSVPYYCTLERAAGSATVTLRIYTDAARTVLFDTLTATLNTASTKHRYIFAMSSVNVGGATAYPCSGYVENINIAVFGSLFFPSNAKRFNSLLVR